MSLNKTWGFLASLCVAVPLIGVTWSEPLYIAPAPWRLK